MTKIQSPFKFDHREMTVIFSLFIFTSLLMFTIGIVVGKSLSQPKTNEVAATEPNPTEHTAHKAEAQTTASHAEGTSVSTDHPESKGHNAKTSHLESVTAEVSEPVETSHAKENHPPQKTAEHSENHPPSQTAELELIPEKTRTGDVRATLSDLADTNEVGKALNNPKVQDLLEEKVSPKPKGPKRNVASVIPKTPPKSFPEGKYTVQVGSYPSQADATLRVDQLRKIGYPFAYLSTKELGDKKEPWYRVWLGYFPDSEMAKASGELLQQRGEVKSYLVRKTDTKED